MTLFVVQTRGDDPAALQRALVIKDGFSWGAFVFGPLWLLYRRLWLALAAWVAFELVLAALALPRLAIGTVIVLQGLVHLFLGLEGNVLRQVNGARRARHIAIIAAASRDEAEARFFRSFDRDDSAVEARP
jgi:hypothetical protein